MKFINNTLQIILIALTFNLNNVSSYAIVDINAKPSTGDECIVRNNCGTNINCIAKCYNVPNPDQESVLRTADCQRTCTVKFPDPYTDYELLNKCYQDCIDNQYFSPQAKKHQKGNTNRGSTTDYVINSAYGKTNHKKGNNSNNNNDNNNNNNNENNNNANNENENNNNQDVNNNNNVEINNENSSTNENVSEPNTNSNNIDDTGKTLNSTITNAFNNNNANAATNKTNNTAGNNNINYIDERSGNESQIYYSLLITELVLVFTVLYMTL